MPIAVRLVDLSAPIEASPAELPEALRTDIEYVAHDDGAQQVEAMLGVTRDLLRDGEGWAVETFTRFGTHNSTHVDAPWHYNSTIAGKPAQTIDELPLEWFYAPGVVIDATDRADGEALSAAEVEERLPRLARSARHRPGADRPRRVLWRARLHRARAGRHSRGDAVAVRARSTRDGHRRLGLGRAAAHAGRARRARSGEQRRLLGARTRPELAYSQIERLCNLGALPATGFTVACFPLRIVKASAAPARVVAILPAE